MTSNLLEHINNGAPRRQKGRAVPALPTFLFEETGVEVSIRRLGPFTMDEIRKKLKKQQQPPTVPTHVVEVGEMAVKLREPNPEDPAYKQAVREYETWLATSTGEQMVNLMVNYCIVVEPEPEVVVEKRTLLDMIDPTLNAEYSDKEVYVRHYLMASTEELEKVQNFILGRSMPTQEAVEEHIESFPGDVQGEGTVSTPSTPIRLPV